MRTREQIKNHLSYYNKGAEVSECGLRCAELLEHWIGLHHIENNAMNKAQWNHPHYVMITCYGNLGTFDGSELTRLVFLAHDLCVRVELVSMSQRGCCFMLNPRHVREGDPARRHPTLETAVNHYLESRPEKFVPAAEGGGA